jgi:phospholipase C
MAIEHAFVLMLENRAFDHMLGFAGLEGTDAITGQATKAVDLNNITLRDVARALNLTRTRDMGKKLGLDVPFSVRELIQRVRSNLDSNSTRVFASTPADFKITSTDEDCVFDPGHEFLNVLMQLCGTAASYPDPGTGKYPSINNSGFIASYAAGPLPSNRPDGSPLPAKIMNCFAPVQIPVLLTLAREFAVCDHWFSSMPGPTWPNRLFIHAASSGGLDDSPSGLEVASAALFDGFDFNNGTIYDRLSARGLAFTIFEGDEFPQSRGIAGIDDDRFVDFDKFGAQVNDPSFASAYTFIEPNYGNDLPLSPEDFTCGNSQHPLDDVTRGERLIKTVYETIRNSPHWEKSVLLITYDEHGGFFDHLPPPTTVAPGDGISDEDNNHHNFDFTQLGVRVPAVVVSPLIPRGTIDHTLYDHTSLVATVESLFGLNPLTNRDRQANTFDHLLSLATPRTDAPATLPNPADSGFHCEGDAAMGITAPPAPGTQGGDKSVPPALRGFLRVAFRRHYQMATAAERPAVISEFLAVKTKQDALKYMQRVREKVRGTLRP